MLKCSGSTRRLFRCLYIKLWCQTWEASCLYITDCKASVWGWCSPRCPAPACAGAPGSVGSGCAGSPQPAWGSRGARKPAWSPNSGPPATERSSPQRRGLRLWGAPLRCRPPARPAPPHRAPSPPAADLKPPGRERRRSGPAWVRGSGVYSDD